MVANIPVVPAGFKRCSNYLNVCCHPDGPILPATSEYFYRHKRRDDGLDNRCKPCSKEAQSDYRRRLGPYKNFTEKLAALEEEHRLQKELSQKQRQEAQYRDQNKKRNYKKFPKSKTGKVRTIGVTPVTRLPSGLSRGIVGERQTILSRTSKANQLAKLRDAAGNIPADDLYLKMQLQDYKCMYCKKKISFNICHIDHIHPIIEGGEHYLYNIALTCSDCNISKNRSSLRTFCRRKKLDYQKIMQEIADINHKLHDLVFGRK